MSKFKVLVDQDIIRYNLLPKDGSLVWVVIDGSDIPIGYISDSYTTGTIVVEVANGLGQEFDKLLQVPSNRQLKIEAGEYEEVTKL